MKVCYSGAFEVLHRGHKHLIDRAIEIAGKEGTVYIGITKDKLSKKKKIKRPLEDRIKSIEKYLKSKNYEKHTVIIPISNRYGPAVLGDYDAIIVSPETIDNAKDINIKRVKNGKKPLRIVKVPYILAQDKKPISSTRIINKEIDEEGKIAI